MASAIVYPGAPPQEQEIVARIINRAEMWEQSIGKDFRRKCEELYRQYRGFKQWEHEWLASPNDRDAWVPEAKKKWGARLHIPLSFRTIETVVPRAIANAPKLIYLPRDEMWNENVRNVQELIDWQQEDISIDLPFQAVMRAGMMYGLGVGKTYWDRKVKMVRRQQERMIPLEGETHELGEPQPKVEFDGPRFADIDVLDFMWDPYGYDVESCGWMAQSVWLTLEGVLERLPSKGGPWNSVTAEGLDEEAIAALPGQNQRYDQIWQTRMRESGFNTTSFASRGEHIHEVLEYHDGENVYSILDRQILVATGENPCGEMPFQVYRPTPLQHQMVGIGALEPLEHLQRELDTLRSQRRDLVTLALNAPAFFDDTSVDAEDINYSPTGLTGVDGDPRAVFMQMPPKEVSGAGFQEEQAILSNIEAVSGLADALDNSPGSGPSNTATEAQLSQAALGRRIELGARRFELEVVRPCACQFLYLDQRMIQQTRTLTVPTQEESADSPSRYKLIKIGPGEIEGEYEIRVEGGSLAAKNIPQDRADAAQLFNTLAGDWFTNPTMVRERFYELMGIKHPKSWLRSPEPSVPLMTLRFMIQEGADPHMVTQAVLRAREVSAPQEGPVAEQMAAMSDGGQR